MNKPPIAIVTNPCNLWHAITGENDHQQFPICPDCVRKIKKAIYKGTDCGAWVEFAPEGVSVGSIVEGVDCGTDTHTLPYPFYISEFWGAVEEVEQEAKRIWDATHGCEVCGMEDPETGYTPINPDCNHCKGHGAII